ncbi:MAG: glycosyltransferase family 2 protein [Planctomycetota bacterium]
MDHPPRTIGSGPTIPAGQRPPSVRLSVVAPAHNEAENVAPLVEQIGAALNGIDFEFLLVDDASTDDSVRIARELAQTRPWLRVISLSIPDIGGGNGQSAAFRTGFATARGELVASLDADLQNDPADIPRLLAELDRTGADFVQGDRSAARRQGDAWIRQCTSVIGRWFRRTLLGDTIRDTGCSLRVLRREIALRLPLEFKGAHRFIPVTARQMGYRVIELPVGHRARHAGEPKYGAGITKRAIPGLIDCFAIRWMGARRRVPHEVTEPTASGTSAADQPVGSQSVGSEEAHA